MTASVLVDPNATGRRGIIDWTVSSDEEGHRNYTVSHHVGTTDLSDGPHTVLNASGLPLVGESWTYGNDFDYWAFCTPKREVKQLQTKKGHPGFHYLVTSHFTTKRNSKRCQDETIEDPLLEPDRVSGSFVKYVKEVTKNYDGTLIKTSSHEVIRGPQVEFDHNRPTVTIVQNVADLELGLVSSLVDNVNDSALWGLSARQVKLSNFSWSREVFGTCDFYFTRTLEFDIDWNGFDKEALDEGTKVLNGHWTTDQTGTGTGLASTWVLDDIDGAAPNKNNPQHFIRYKDRRGENSRVVLDGNGQPLDGDDSPVYISIQYYPQSNLLLLGIPTDLSAS